MQSTKIYLVRHGESIGNLERRFLGHTDLDLTDLGYKQADCVAEYFKDTKVDSIYSSDLKRAYNTVKPLAQNKGLEIALSKNLREVFAGDWEGTLYADIEKNTPSHWSAWGRADSENMGPKNGETMRMLQDRIYKELLKIAGENEGKTVVVGTHATPIRVITNLLTLHNLNCLCDTPWTANASVTLLAFDGEKFALEFTNERSHLGSLVTVLPPNI